MSWFDDNIEQIRIGFDGESAIRELFKDKKIPFMQVDIMFKFHNKWCLGEIKTQELYLSPPFDGHGLPEWQINRRLQFHYDTGVEPYLFVNCLTNKCIYYNSIINLERGEKFKTKGSKPRIIYNLESFKKI